MVNYISGNDANNTLNGTSTRDRLYGYGGNDTLCGYSSDDALFGGSGNDTLVGGFGTDWLQGGTGSSSANDVDILNGEQDNSTDYYVLGNQTSSYYTGSGYAILRNFNAALDRIVIADDFSTARITVGIAQRTGNTAVPDTVIRLNGDVVGVIEDASVTSLPLIRSNRVNQAIWT